MVTNDLSTYIIESLKSLTNKVIINEHPEHENTFILTITSDKFDNLNLSERYDLINEYMINFNEDKYFKHVFIFNPLSKKEDITFKIKKALTGLNPSLVDIKILEIDQFYILCVSEAFNNIPNTNRMDIMFNLIEQEDNAITNENLLILKGKTIEEMKTFKLSNMLK